MSFHGNRPMQNVLGHATEGICIYRVCGGQPCLCFEVPDLKGVPFLAACLLVTGSVQRHRPNQNLQVLLAFGVSMGYSPVASVNMVMIVDDML